MYKITVKINFEYAHRLMNHPGKCRYIHGHSGQAIVEFASHSLDNNGFVMDFADVRTPLKHWVDQYWDHAYLANEADILLPNLYSNGMKIFTFPQEPTAEVMARHLFDQARSLEQPEIRLLQITIQETCTGSATYSPEPLRVKK